MIVLTIEPPNIVTSLCFIVYTELNCTQLKFTPSHFYGKCSCLASKMCDNMCEPTSQTLIITTCFTKLKFTKTVTENVTLMLLCGIDLVSNPELIYRWSQFWLERQMTPWVNIMMRENSVQTLCLFATKGQ